MTAQKKAIQEYDRMLNSHIENKDFICVARGLGVGESPISGFLLKISDCSILIQNEFDFQLDGYVIIPKDRFDSIRSNRSDKMHKSILQREGTLNRDYGIKADIDLAKLADRLQLIKKT